MKRYFAHWLAPRVQTQPGLLWCAAWFGALALILFPASVLTEGLFARLFLIIVGALYVYACLGLLRGLKAGWHIAAFLAFAMIVTRGVAVACAPGNIASGERSLFGAAFDVLLLALALVVFGYLRKPDIRRIYGVPDSYRTERRPPE